MYQRTKNAHQLSELVKAFELEQISGQYSFWEYEDVMALAQHYEDSLNFIQSLKVIELALERFPYQCDLYILKSKYLALNHQLDEALMVLDSAEIIAPSQPEIRIFRSELLTSVGRYSEALTILEDMSASMMPTEWCHVLLCKTKIYESMKDFDSMFDTLRLVLEIDPDNHQALEEIWMSVEHSKRYHDSIALHQEVLDKNPYSHLAWFNLGHAYSCIGNYNKAIEALEYAFIIDAEFEAAYLDCAELCYQERKYEKAFQIYEEFNDRFGPDAETLVYMVECLLPIKKFKQAKKLLLLALTLDPYNDEVHYYLGKCHLANADWKEAVKAFNKAIKIDERREEYHMSIAHAYGKLHKVDLAIHYYKKATFYAPEQNEYWVEYAQFAKKNIGLESALDIIRMADEHAVGSDLLFEKAMCLYELGLKKQAVVVLEEALMDDPVTTEFRITSNDILKADEKIQALVRYYIEEEL